ncbi:MAG: hypothetical protein ACR2PZ_06480 [Pseudomonadales bacterium]
MNILRVLTALGPMDAKTISRDSLLRWMIVITVPLALLLRWGLPALAGRIEQLYQFDITPYYPLVMSFNMVLMPILAGLVIGFLLLDQRDDNTLAALQVTPLSLRGYLAYRIAAPIVLSIVLTIVLFRIAALTPVSFFPLFWMSIAVAPLAAVFALFLGTFAANKVQGFALTKANGVITLPPVTAYFVAGDWQLAFGVVPTYWPAKAFWEFAGGTDVYWVYALIGFVFQCGLLILLLRRFEHVMHQ